MKTPILLLLPLLASGLHAQNSETSSADPYAGAETSSAQGARATEPRNLSICYEVFALPLEHAAAYRRDNISDTELYSRLLAALKTGDVKQEHFAVLRGRSGEKFTTEAIVEQIYPTEYEPPELPNQIGLGVTMRSNKEGSDIPDLQQLEEAPPVAAVEGLSTPATPTAFETRNEGITVELAPTLSASSDIVDLNIAPEHVTHVGESRFGQGLAETSMPLFETSRINTAVTATINRPFLLGTLNRPPNSKVDPDSANKVWFAFVTVTLARP